MCFTYESISGCVLIKATFLLLSLKNEFHCFSTWSEINKPNKLVSTPILISGIGSIDNLRHPANVVISLAEIIIPS